MSRNFKEALRAIPKSRRPVVEVFHQPEVRDDGTVHYSGVTLVRLRDPNSKEVLTHGVARTNKNLDCPNRKIGVEVALGRALKKYFS